MRVLLVTFTDMLPFVLTKVLNPALEYCAIVVDDAETARDIAKNVKPLQNLIRPFYELEQCVEIFHYDFVLCVSDGRLFWDIHKRLSVVGVPLKKFFHIGIVNNGTLDLSVEKTLRYYSEHSTEFEMFATGISYTSVALDATKFKYKLFNFGLSSQDLYYDYQIAKFVLSPKGGSGHIKYALIGLAPYSFHYDLSQSYGSNFQLLKYFIAFDDVHNFWLPKEQIPNVVRKEYMAIRLPSGIVNLNNVYGEKNARTIFMNWQKHLNAREKIDDWKNRNYPETVKENIKILDEYLALCEENNVRPIMFLPTMTQGYIKYFNRKMIDEFYYLVRAAQKKHRTALFFDGWNVPNFSDKNFYDASHLNLQGAAKFSAILNGVIEEVDHTAK